jgi:hypothetical protein
MLCDHPAEALQDLRNGLVEFSLASITAEHICEDGFKLLIDIRQNNISSFRSR